MRRCRSFVIAAAASFAVGCARPHVDAPASPPSQPAQATQSSLFAFHSSAWLNLHHVLYAEGLKKLGRPTRGGGGGDTGSDGLEKIATTSLDEAERAAWNASVDHYASTLSTRDLTFDDELPDINNALSALENAPTLQSASALPAALVPMLARAMPAYRAHFWTEHQKDNAAYVASLEPLVARHGFELSRELARIYRIEWPKEPFRVDVSRYASWAGAYTTLRPTHLTIASVDYRNQGSLGLEILFHETSHGLIHTVKDALAKELSAQGKSSRDLWHALLFFTTGDAVRRRIPGHVPYAIKFGLYEGIPQWKPFFPALEAHWKPYIEGRTTFEVAIHDVVAAL